MNLKSRRAKIGIVFIFLIIIVVIIFHQSIYNAIILDEFDLQMKNEREDEVLFIVKIFDNNDRSLYYEYHKLKPGEERIIDLSEFDNDNARLIEISTIGQNSDYSDHKKIGWDDLPYIMIAE